MIQRIILASGSEQRKKLFTALNLPYESVTAGIDESLIRNPNPQRQAVLIARAKAEAVAEREQGIVIAADTFGVHGNTLMEKPRDQKRQQRIIHELHARPLYGVPHSASRALRHSRKAVKSSPNTV